MAGVASLNRIRGSANTSIFISLLLASVINARAESGGIPRPASLLTSSLINDSVLALSAENE